MQVNEEHDSSMIAHMTSGLALYPTSNTQGGYYFMSISTRHVVNWLNVTPIPMPDDVVDRLK